MLHCSAVYIQILTDLIIAVIANDCPFIDIVDRVGTATVTFSNPTCFKMFYVV